MALIKCPECGSEISDKAMSCPRCGCPISTANGEETQIQSKLKMQEDAEEKVIVLKKDSGCGGCTTFVVLLVIALICLFYYVSEEESLEVPTYCEKVTVNQMRDDLKKNEVKAQDTYSNKWFEISGILGDMDSEGSYFHLEDEHFLFAYSIKCRIPRNKKDMIVNKLKIRQKGKALTVKGKITDMGELMGYEVTVVDIY